MGVFFKVKCITLIDNKYGGNIVAAEAEIGRACGTPAGKPASASIAVLRKRNRKRG